MYKSKVIMIGKNEISFKYGLIRYQSKGLFCINGIDKAVDMGTMKEIEIYEKGEQYE